MTKGIGANKRGAASIFGAIFLVLIFIVFTYSLTYFQQQSLVFSQGLEQSFRESIERTNEDLRISDLNYTVEADKVLVHFTVQNEAPMTIRLINLWVLDSTRQTYGYDDSLDISLNPGAIRSFRDSNAISVPLVGASSLDLFTSWFVTYRGSIIPLEEKSNSIYYADLAKGIGSLVLDFDRFTYYTYSNPDTLRNYSDGTLGYDIPRNTYVAFACYLKNLDPKGRTIVLDSHSLFWQPGRSGVNEGAWFLVNVNEDGTISNNYSPITIGFGEEKLFVFASRVDMGLGAFDRLRTPNAATTVATFLLLHGTAGNMPFAQNIPYVSIFYS